MGQKFVWISLVLAICCGQSWSLTCSGANNCVFQTSQGPVDLNSLSSTPPAFTVKNDQVTFTFDPCKNFDITGSATACTGVNGCQQAGPLEYYPLGDITSTECKAGTQESDFIIQFHKEYEAQDRITSVTVRCGDQDKLEYTKEEPKLTYNFVLTTKNACQASGGSGLSAGSILCIIFFVVLILYFILGALFMWGMKGASGLDIIPNRDFWTSLPGLIKDGVSFTINKIRGTETSSSYENIK